MSAARVHPDSAATIDAAVTSSAVLALRMAEHIAHVNLGSVATRAPVSAFLVELRRFTEAVTLHGPIAAVDTFTPR